MADQELIQRVRRIETRLTRLLIGLGIETEAKRPVFDAGSIGGQARLTLPSHHCSIKEVMSAVPKGFAEPVELYVGDDRVASLDAGDRSC